MIKKLNFYNVKSFEKPIHIKINEEITFDGKDLFYELDYSKPNNISKMCILVSTFVSYDCEVYMIYSNLKEDYIYLLEGVIEYFPFECASDGAYSINIKSLSEEEFTIISTGIPFDLDFTKYINFYFYSTFNYQPSPLILNIDSSKLGIYFLTYFYRKYGNSYYR